MKFLTFHSKLLRFQLFTLQNYKSFKTQNENGKKIITETFTFFFLSVFAPNPYELLKSSVNASRNNFMFSNLTHESVIVCSSVNIVLDSQDCKAM